MKRKLLFVLSGMLAVFLFCGMNSANAVEAKIQASGMQLQSKSAVLMSSNTNCKYGKNNDIIAVL